MKLVLGSEFDEHLAVIKSAADKIIERPITSNVTDLESAEPLQLSKQVRMYFGSKSRSELKRIKVDFSMDEDQMYAVRAHREWLTVLWQLLAKNAADALAKIANPQIEIELTIDKPSSKLCLAITDNGSGFDEAILPLIFVKQIDKLPHEDGLGIGLLMARLIVNSYGGEISAENVKNSAEKTVGAKIKIEFPITEAQQIKQAEAVS